MAGGRKLKFTFYFMESTHEPLHLDKLSFERRQIIDIPTSFIWIIIFLDGAFEYGGISKLWGYVGKRAKLICVELCNFVQCHILASYLCCYCLSKVFWIFEIRRPKNTRCYIRPYIYFYLEFITRAKESRHWVQSLNTICHISDWKCPSRFSFQKSEDVPRHS
jgi:hypothetical protein